MAMNSILLLNSLSIVFICLGVLIVGGVAGFFGHTLLSSRKTGKAKSSAIKILEDAYTEAKTIKKEAMLEAKEEALKVKTEFDKEMKERRTELQRSEDRLAQREDFVDKKEIALDKKSEVVETMKNQLSEKQVEIDAIKSEQLTIKENMLKELEKVADLKRDEAKQIIINNLLEKAKIDAAKMVMQVEADAKEEADKKAKNIVTLAIQKCATDLCQDITVSSIVIPDDEMKGRIIGREGRNIRALENATGVDLIVDDTPEVITISSFDPIKREVARLSLEKLILDGRIHPARIEEVVNKVRRDLDVQIKEAGNNACNQSAVYGLHPELVKTLGKLKFRTSYGQNCLNHSLETCYIAGLLAAEVGADIKVAKRGGLLHDIGKALDHELEGTHISIGVDLAKRYKESPAVIHCIEAHHGGVEFNSIEAILVQVADAISSSRPGARRETLEIYTKRLEQLEAISNSFAGVDKTFAIQAGREVRIIVKPEQISDEQAMFLAKDIAERIEKEMEYPGQIKVNVVREARFVATAK